MTETDWLKCDSLRELLNFVSFEVHCSTRRRLLFRLACCRRVWHLLTDPRSRQAVEAGEKYADRLLDKKELKPYVDAAVLACEQAALEEATLLGVETRAAEAVRNAIVERGVAKNDAQRWDTCSRVADAVRSSPVNYSRDGLLCGAALAVAHVVKNIAQKPMRWLTGNIASLTRQALMAQTWDHTYATVRAESVRHLPTYQELTTVSGRYDALDRTGAACMLAREAGRKEETAQCALLRCILGNPVRPITISPDWLKWDDGTVQNLAQIIYDEHRFADLPILADALEEAGCTNEDILHHCRHDGLHARGCHVVDLILERKW